MRARLTSAVRSARAMVIVAEEPGFIERTDRRSRQRQRHKRARLIPPRAPALHHDVLLTCVHERHHPVLAGHRQLDAREDLPRSLVARMQQWYPWKHGRGRLTSAWPGKVLRRRRAYHQESSGSFRLFRRGSGRDAGVMTRNRGDRTIRFKRSLVVVGCWRSWWLNWKNDHAEASSSCIDGRLRLCRPSRCGGAAGCTV